MRKTTMLLSLSFVLNNSYSQVEIIAHRGASYLAPENTVASSKLAWKLGADAVEVDIYLSKDNEIMCIHDSNTRRTTGMDHVVSDTGSEVLRNLDAGSFKDPKYKGEKIPFLQEIIKAVPKGKELVVEIKCGSEVLPYLKGTIEKNGRNKKIVFISFDLQTITETKNTFPENKCYWLCSNRELLEKNLNHIPGAGLDGVSLSYGIINENVAAEVNKLNLDLFAWTVDDPEEARRLISLGIKGITTNRPGWLNDQIF
jgi:glycerophosphoryl diester phosphodiesterase